MKIEVSLSEWGLIRSSPRRILIHELFVKPTTSQFASSTRYGIIGDMTPLVCKVRGRAVYIMRIFRLSMNYLEGLNGLSYEGIVMALGDHPISNDFPRSEYRSKPLFQNSTKKSCGPDQ